MPGNFSNKGKSKTIGSVFVNRSKAGKKYFKISLSAEAIDAAEADEKGYYSLLAFENGFKETENHPDLVVYLSEPKPEKKPAFQKKFVKNTPVKKAQEASSDEKSDDNSPF